VESHEVDDVNGRRNKKNFHDRVVVAVRKVLEDVDVSGAKDNKKELLEAVGKPHAVLLVPHSFDQQNKGQQVKHVSHNAEKVHGAWL
jgi:hypothetical protein